jgi:hypothetical protein
MQMALCRRAASQFAKPSSSRMHSCLAVQSAGVFGGADLLSLGNLDR